MSGWDPEDYGQAVFTPEQVELVTREPERDWLMVVIQLTIVILLAALSVSAWVAIDRLQDQRIDVNVNLTPQGTVTQPAPEEMTT